jgi:OHCU decarboxylase
LSEAFEHLNSWPRERAEAELLKCCGSSRWARQMTAARPFQDEQELLEKADHIWWSLDGEDWLEAFSHHPKIGEKKAAQAQSAEARRWSEHEQAGATRAATQTLLALAEANRAYERRFGFIFIVCATGKTAAEMLELCEGRLNNAADVELRIAAEEQRRITQLRLKKLLEQ